jgi:hypothetical protein
MMHTLDLKFEVEHHKMSNTPHKWVNEIIAWALGNQIQIRVLKVDNNWSDWFDLLKSSGVINWDNPEYEFRIKQN